MRKQPRQQRSRALVQSLVEATGRVIEARGLEFATTNHIAESAGVDIASLYQYFENKEDLVEELLRHHASQMVAMATDYFKSINMFEASPSALLRGALSLGLGLARRNPVLLELAQHPKFFFSSQGIVQLENHLQTVATTYFMHHFRSYPMENLQTRLYIVSKSAFTLIARHLSEPNSMISDAELVDNMVLLYAPFFESGAVLKTEPLQQDDSAL